jgi:hypothetical protein
LLILIALPCFLWWQKLIVSQRMPELSTNRRLECLAIYELGLLRGSGGPRRETGNISRPFSEDTKPYTLSYII